MKLITKIFEYLSYQSIHRFSFIRLLPDNVFLKIKYRIRTKRKLNLRDPIFFSEKLQWLKINDKNIIYNTLVDKFVVREFIESIIGKYYLNDLYGYYEKFDDICFDELPTQFVIKCTHGSGCNYICEDKNKINYIELRKKINKWLKSNYYYYGREWPYKNVKPAIIIEKYLGKEILDYKFYCFSGEPKFLYVSKTDINGKISMTFYDLNWNILPFFRSDHEKLNFDLQKPKNFDEMILIAKKLSLNLPFARIDVFNIDDSIIFSEITLTPGSGFGLFCPLNYETEIGSLIKLPTNRKNHD